MNGNIHKSQVQHARRTKGQMNIIFINYREAIILILTPLNIDTNVLYMKRMYKNQLHLKIFKNMV